MQKGKLFALVMALVLMLAAAASASAVGKDDLKISLPADYNKNISYPVIYMLPHDGVSNYIDVMDELHTGMDLIVVQPKKLPSTDLHTYLNDVVAFVDSEYSTIKDAKYRALIGSGVGGYLAYALGMTDTKGDFIKSPEMFSFIASINGNFVNNVFYNTYGDIYNALKSESNTEALNNYFTYMDTPVDDPWANDEGSTNDLGELFIEVHDTEADAHEYTARLGSFTKEFQKESATRIADRFAIWMLSDIFSGSFSLAEPSVNYGDNAVLSSTVSVSDELAKITDKEISFDLIAKMTDPKTDKATLTSKTITLGSGASVAKTLEVKNTMSGDSGIVSLAITWMGKTYQLASTNMVSTQSPIFNGDYQAISLLGDWHFTFLGSSFFGTPTLDGSKLSNSSTSEYADAQKWTKVIPGLDRWTIGFGGITLDSVKSWHFILDYGYGENDIIYGNGYYVKTFNVSEKFTTDSPILSLGYLDDRCEVWLNGKRIGGTGIDETGNSTKETTWAAYSAFEVDPDDINVGENVLAVRVQNDNYGGGGGWYGGPIGFYSPSAFDAVNPEKPDPYFYEEEFYSASLSADNKYLIYLPEDYYDTDYFYPTLYLLHQYNSDHTSYKTDAVNDLFDAAARANILDEMVVVIPNSEGSSFWRDKWENMIVDDLIPHIEENYRVIPDSRYRFTTGCSMGGQGAMGVALTNPNYFSGAVSIFGAFSMGGDESPNKVAAEESKEYLDYFSTAFICGNQDFYGFGAPAVDLHQQLEAKGIDHRFLIENGGHDNVFYLPRFIDTIAYVRNNMYQMPKGSAADLINVDYISNAKELIVTFTPNMKIKNFFNVIPASKYTKDTTPGLTIPVIATIEYEVKPGALALLYATALAEAKEAQVKFFVTFTDEELIVTENVDLTDVIPSDATIKEVTFHTQLLGRDLVSDSLKLEKIEGNGNNLPQTGDNSNIFLFAALLLVSVSGMIVISKKKAAC